MFNGYGYVCQKTLMCINKSENILQIASNDDLRVSTVSEEFHILKHIFIEYIYNMQTLCFYPIKILFLITINWEWSFSSSKTKLNLIVTFWKWGPYHIKALKTRQVQLRRILRTTRSPQHLPQTPWIQSCPPPPTQD